MIVCQVCKDKGDKSLVGTGMYQCKTCKARFASKLKDGFRTYIDQSPDELKLFEDAIWFSRYQAEQAEYSSAQILMTSLGITPGSRVLEIGCGYGWGLMELRRHGLKADGVEWHNKALANCNKYGLEVFGLDPDLEVFGVPDSEYDFVVLTKRLDSFWSPHRLVELSQRSCKPGGRIKVEEGKNKVFNGVFDFTSETWNYLAQFNGIKPVGLGIKTAEK